MIRDRTPSAPFPDAAIVRRVLAGEREEYAALIRRHQDSLYRHALGMVGDGDAAADLVQESFVKAYTSLGQCEDPSMFRSWIFRILRNRCLDHLKNRRRRDVSLEESTVLAVAPDDPAQDLARSETARAIRAALAELPDAQREAFLLKHVEGHSYEEIAESSGASVSALKMRVKRAREALQEALTRYPGTDVTDGGERSSVKRIDESREDSLAQQGTE